MRMIFFVTLLAVICSLDSSIARAQSKSRPLQIDILMAPGTSAQLVAREWASAFQMLGYSPTFRQGRQGERTTVQDVTGRRGASVKIIGLLDRAGTISFIGQKFNVTQEEPLKQWLQKLEAFGAKGPPHEHPTWGLSEDQYKDVLKLLRPAVDREVDFSSAMKAIDSLRLPTAFKLKFTPAAAKRAFDKVERIGDDRPDLASYSKGTALAIALAQFGLGFRPLQNPDGRFFIEVDVGDETSNMYPVGWNNSAPLTTLVPTIAKSISVDLQGVPLDGLLQTIAKTLKLPLVYSAAKLKSEGRDPSEVKYTRKPDKLSPYRLMSVLATAHEIGIAVRTDEAGKLFLWVTSKSDFDAFRTRFR